AELFDLCHRGRRRTVGAGIGPRRSGDRGATAPVDGGGGRVLPRDGYRRARRPGGGRGWAGGARSGERGRAAALISGATMEGTAAVRRRMVLTGISSRAWEHPADRGALTALRELRGFDELLKTLSGLWNERAWRLEFLGRAIRVDHRQHPRVHRLFA